MAKKKKSYNEWVGSGAAFILEFCNLENERNWHVHLCTAKIAQIIFLLDFFNISDKNGDALAD